MRQHWQQALPHAPDPRMQALRLYAAHEAELKG
jgi:hypothetical protein